MPRQAYQEDAACACKPACAGVSSIEAANAFLETWLDPFNKKFGVVAREEEDGHRAFPEATTRQSVFCIEETRTIGKDWTVRHDNVWYQVLKQKPLPPVGSKVTVQTARDGQVVIVANGHTLVAKQWPLSIQRLDKAPLREKPEPPRASASPEPAIPRTPHKPAADDPWRGEAQDTAKVSADRPAKPARPEEINALMERYLGTPPALVSHQTPAVY